MNKIVFNHSYVLKHDRKRTYIIASENSVGSNCIKGWVSKIHPIYAMILSFLSTPCTEQEAIDKISSFLEVAVDDAEKILSLFIRSKKPFTTEYHAVNSVFPGNLIVNADSEQVYSKIYYPQQFAYEDIDVAQQRCYVSPIGLVFMVNNVCATNCIYCYADKYTKSTMLSLQEVEKMCLEAKKLGIESMAISGGEVFMYPEWYSLLRILIKYGYKPNLISTKYPLSEYDIRRLKSLEIKLQVSLDAFDSSTLSGLLNVNFEYFTKIKQTIFLLDQYEMNFQVATVITNRNCSISNLNSLFTFLSSLKFLSRWEIRIAFRSLYSRDDFNSIKVTKEQIQSIDNWVREKILCSSMNILWSPENGRKYFQAEHGSPTFSGSRCSANFSHMVVLPDGKVTICEQLYWNPQFIIGDIKKQNIAEIWNSSKALYLAHVPQIDVRSSSVCSSCKLYDLCLDYPNKCYADVLKAYGRDNWDYPDPRCNQAPKFIYDMY